MIYFGFYLVSNDGKFTASLGTQESAQWIPETDSDTSPSLSYSSGEKNVTVALRCGNDGSNEFQAFGENPVNNFKFRLTHKCACWDGCSSE